MQKHVSRNDLPRIVPIEKKTTETSRRVSPRIARIHLLGSMRASSYLGADILPRGKKARAILASLCLAGGARVPRSRLAAMLWDRVPDFQARASFRQAFRELIVAFGPLADELIQADRETVRMTTDACWVDVLAILSPETNSSQRSELVQHCSGELLEELDNVSPAFGLWLLGERSRYNENLRKLFESELTVAHASNSDARERADIARRLIAFDPTHEGASRILMRALADIGERAQALREYARCREALKTTMDIEPSPETHALYEAIRSFSGHHDRESHAPTVEAPKTKKKVSKEPPAPARNRLRVGVLPLLATRAPQDDDVAVSVSQEVAAALARFRWFDVIPPLALKRGEEAAAAIEANARPNELDYVVDGALSFNNGKYQISVRLLDLTHYATHVWSGRFELGPDEFHTLDEVVVAPIAARIDPVILFIEGQPKRREQYGATGLLMQAIPKFYSMERETFEKAGDLIKQALDIEPENPMVLAWMAHWHMSHVGQGWTKDSKGTLARAEELCLRAIRLDPDNAEALGIYAHTCSWKKDFDNALHYFDRALRSNPNLAFVWALSAITHCYIGDTDEALARMERYRQLAPFDPYFCFFESIYATAYTIRGDYEQAVTFGRRAAKANPQFINGYKPLIASLGHLGLLDEAKELIAVVLKLEPDFTVKQFAEIYPFRTVFDAQGYLDGLRLAGVPEE